MIGIWADYVGYPGGAALRNAGFVGAIRYVGIGGTAKRLTAAELADLTTHGLQVLGVAESTATRANAGYSAGVADAQAVLADPVAKDIPIIFATNDQPTFTKADVDYVAGFASVLGPARTGAYGFGDFLAAVHAAGTASCFWQAGHPPPVTGTSGFAHLWQRQGYDGTPPTVVVNGVTCDINNQLLEVPTMTTLDDTVHSGVPGSTVRYPLWQGIVNSDAYSWELLNQAVPALKQQITELGAQVAGLVSAVSKLTEANAANEPVTGSQIKQWLDDVVAQHVRITGTVSVSSTPTQPSTPAAPVQTPAPATPPTTS